MSKSLIKRLQQIHVGHWLLFLVLSQTVYFVMLLVSIPSISREAGGMRIFDMQPLGYTYDYAYQFCCDCRRGGMICIGTSSCRSMSCTPRFYALPASARSCCSSACMPE